MSDEYCVECGDPLGSTIERCFDCGGDGTRGGTPIDPHQWQVWLGVKVSYLKDLNFAARNIDNPEHVAHPARGGSNE